jgi:hypothetical protein
MSDSTPYEDHLLGARDTCTNCFRLIRREREQRESTASLASIKKSPHTRVETTTNIEYPGVGDEPTHSQAVFCECGVESARERLWSAADLSRERFKDLLQNALRTLDEKGVTLKPTETAAYALQAFDDEKGPDAALAEAIDAGIIAAAAADGQDRELRADGGPTCDTES